MISKEKVMESLRKVTYPGFSRDIVSFGIITDVMIDEQNVRVQMSLKSADAEIGKQIKADAQERLEADFKGLDIEINLAMETPKAKAAGNSNTSQFLPNVKFKLAVASGKGGVGKSTVAVNLAIAFSKMGWKTGLLDADIYGPSIPLMLGINEKPYYDGSKIHPFEKHGVYWMSIGFLVNSDDAVIWRGALVHRAIQQLMNDVAWPDLDIIFFDMPPGTGDAQLTLSQSVALDGAVIVSTPQDVALVDAIKGVQMFRKVNVPIMGLIENMSYFICPHCGDRSDIFSSGGVLEAGKKLQVELLGQIPLDSAIRQGGDEGMPTIISESAISKSFHSIADSIKNKLNNK